MTLLPGANVAAIIRDGLDPARRNGQSQGTGEYFADDPAMSVLFCQGDNTLLLFAVMMVRSDGGATRSTDSPNEMSSVCLTLTKCQSAWV